MSNVPYDYEELNLAAGTVTPSTIHTHGTGVAAYYRRYLAQRLIGAYALSSSVGIPADYALVSLMLGGTLAIIDTPEYGVIAQACNAYGFNIYRQPYAAQIANPLLPDLSGKELVIGRDCALIHISPDYCGLYDIVSYYADMMALASEAINGNIQNSKLAYVFTAGGKAAAESFKKLYDRIAEGEPAVVYDKSLLNADGSSAWDSFAQNLSSNFIAPNLCEVLRTLTNRFDTIVGIPNANTSKRERLITDEVNANNTETSNLPLLWMRTAAEGVTEANRLYPSLNLSVSYLYGGDQDERNA